MNKNNSPADAGGNEEIANQLLLRSMPFEWSQYEKKIDRLKSEIMEALVAKDRKIQELLKQLDEMPGMVQAWHARALTAENKVRELEQKLRDAGGLVEKANKVLNLAPASTGDFAQALHGLSEALKKYEEGKL